MPAVIQHHAALAKARIEEETSWTWEAYPETDKVFNNNTNKQIDDYWRIIYVSGVRVSLTMEGLRDIANHKMV